MFSLPEGWDDNLNDEKAPADSTFRPPLADFSCNSLFIAPSSKAAELLRRASDYSHDAQPAIPEPPQLEEANFAMTDAHPGGAALSGGASSPPCAAPDKLMSDAAPYRGVFDDVELPHGGDADVRELTSSAPHAFNLAFSFRASLRGRLVALPVAQPQSGGTFRIKLLQLEPQLLHRSGPAGGGQEDVEADARSGEALLAMQVRVGFATTGAAEASTLDAAVPRSIVPHGDSTKLFLDQYMASGDTCVLPHAKESFELLATVLCGAGGAQGGSIDRPGGAQPRELVRRFSAWLSRVNGRTVEGSLKQRAPSSARNGPRLLDLGAVDAVDAAGSGLEAAFHRLTANSIRGALQGLGAASDHAEAGSSVHFDRLSAIIASCGGTSTPCMERRQWLRRQVEEWRTDGVHELMGPALWRIYTLLAGDLEDVLAEAIDWRTALGMYVWYRAAPGGADELLKAVRDFEAAAARYGSGCCFRPAPPYTLSKPISPCSSIAQMVASPDSQPEPYDLQFNIIRTAVGLSDWQDLRHFDYVTYTARPLDVACSWHVSVLYLAACNGDTATPEFQLLTQQYCLLLEVTGSWEWAVYVALFVRDARARSCLVRGIIQRNAALSGESDLKPVVRQQWPGVPAPLLSRIQALRSEQACDWLAAVASWLQCGGLQRAAILALGYLQGPTALKHAVAPVVQCGASDAMLLAPMTPPARWLLGVLEEVESLMACCDEGWAHVGKDALLFMRSWSAATAKHYEPTSLVQLYSKCDMLRRHILGIPW
mmetsp:Transcript_59311/g.167032  ORF Transcript_59311/g.167032 Transcript_59311/m.167032 type:complete len:768 (-) Transcript_59311:53-2356(-)